MDRQINFFRSLSYLVVWIIKCDKNIIHSIWRYFENFWLPNLSMQITPSYATSHANYSFSYDKDDDIMLDFSSIFARLTHYHSDNFSFFFHFPETDWLICVHTSDILGAGTDANVFITFYGKKDGKFTVSNKFTLDKKDNNFEQGKVDRFHRSMDIGIPYKLRVGHDNSGLMAEWHLDRVRITSLLLTWINFIPAWISNHMPNSVGWNYSSIPKLQRLHHWSLEMDK